MNYATTALACLLAVTLVGCGRKADEETARREAAPAVTGAVTQEVQSVAIPDQAEAVGTVRARTSALVMARIPGTVTQQVIKRYDKDGDFELTQAQMGDTLGLSAVHVNRTLKALKESGAVEIEGRIYRIPDWPRLAAMAEFDPE